MYRGRPWTMRQYAGFATAAESNRRYRYLLSQGVSGLIVDLRDQALHWYAARKGIRLSTSAGEANPPPPKAPEPMIGSLVETAAAGDG